jgi:hypothetical protein
LPDWTIRNANEEDIPAVLDLWAAADSPPSVSDSPDGLARLLSADPEALLVAELGCVVVGSLIAAWDGWRGSFLPAGGVARATARGACDDVAQGGASGVYASEGRSG